LPDILENRLVILELRVTYLANSKNLLHFWTVQKNEQLYIDLYNFLKLVLAENRKAIDRVGKKI